MPDEKEFAVVTEEEEEEKEEEEEADDGESMTCDDSRVDSQFDPIFEIESRVDLSARKRKAAAAPGGDDDDDLALQNVAKRIKNDTPVLQEV